MSWQVVVLILGVLGELSFLFCFFIYISSKVEATKQWAQQHQPPPPISFQNLAEAAKAIAAAQKRASGGN